MYCVKCGVELADTEKQCPLCKTTVFHPDIVREKEDNLYPQKKYPQEVKVNNLLFCVLLTAASVLSVLIVLLCDLQFNKSVTWSGYVVGAVIIGYIIFVLPFWFKNPNPVIFVPCSFAAVCLYVFYINLITNGNWFLSFALPVIGGIGIIVTTVVTLLWYLRRGKLFIIGGSAIAMGLFMLLVEFLLNLTFDISKFVGWSLYPLITLVFLGGLLIFLGACRPAREAMERKFFI